MPASGILDCLSYAKLFYTIQSLADIKPSQTCNILVTSKRQGAGMSFINSLIVMLVLALPAGMADARQDAQKIEQRLTPEQLRETGLDTLTPAQLARLNELLSAPVAVSAASPSAPTMASAPALAGTPSAAPAAPVAQPGVDKPLFGFNDAPIKSRLKGTITGWEEGTVFTLENGQQWKVLKGNMKLPKPMIDPDIRVVPGLVGRWFLEVHEDYPKARVYLIN